MMYVDILRLINDGCVGEQHPTNFTQLENLRTFRQLKPFRKKAMPGTPYHTRLKFSDSTRIVRLSSLLMCQLWDINSVFAIDAHTTFSEQVLLLSMKLSEDSPSLLNTISVKGLFLHILFDPLVKIYHLQKFLTLNLIST